MSHTGKPRLLLILRAVEWAAASWQGLLSHHWTRFVCSISRGLLHHWPSVLIHTQIKVMGKKRHLTSVMWAEEWEVSRHDNNHINPCLQEWKDRDLTTMEATRPWPQKAMCFVSSLVLPWELLSTSLSQDKNKTFLTVKRWCWDCVGVTKKKSGLCLTDFSFHLGNDVFVY